MAREEHGPCRARSGSSLSTDDHVVPLMEHLVRARHVDGLRAQLLEEMSCLGHRLVEAAAAMTGHPRPAEDSGVFELRDVLGVAE
jgi:hypothetical protein